MVKSMAAAQEPRGMMGARLAGWLAVAKPLVWFNTQQH